MNNRKYNRVSRGPMRSMKELREEKFRLQREIADTEEAIKSDYGHIVDALTFRNIINTIAEEIVATNFMVSQAYSIIRPLFKRKKKNKKAKEKEPGIETISG